MIADGPTVIVQCAKCRHDLPAGVSFCRVCGRAQGPDPVTRSVRGAARRVRRLQARGLLFGVEPVLWLFAALGGIAISVTRNAGNVISLPGFLQAVALTMVLLLCAAGVARLAWSISGLSQTAGLISGMAVTFVVPIVVIAVTLNQPRAFAGIGGSSAAQGIQIIPSAPVLPLPPAQNLPSPQPAPPQILRQLPVRWRQSGRRIDCTISNESDWHVEEVGVQVTLWADQRPLRNETCRLPARMAPGGKVTLDLPVLVQFPTPPGQTWECRVVTAWGVDPARMAPGRRVR